MYKYIHKQTSRPTDQPTDRSIATSHAKPKSRYHATGLSPEGSLAILADETFHCILGQSMSLCLILRCCWGPNCINSWRSFGLHYRAQAKRHGEKSRCILRIVTDWKKGPTYTEWNRKGKGRLFTLTQKTKELVQINVDMKVMFWCIVGINSCLFLLSTE